MNNIIKTIGTGALIAAGCAAGKDAYAAVKHIVNDQLCKHNKRYKKHYTKIHLVK